jgi:hypothetical protein
MPLFPSPEWMDAFCDELATQPGAAQAAAVLDGVYRFVVEADGPLEDRHSYDVRIARTNGDEADVRRLETEETSPRLTLHAKYGRWKQLIRGELDVVMAVMLRRVRVSGSIEPLRNANTKPLLTALRSVDTTWLDA